MVRNADLVIINKKEKKVKRKKWTKWIVDFAFPADQRKETKENEKRDKYLDLTKELKSYGTLRRCWYQYLLVHAELSSKTW